MVRRSRDVLKNFFKKGSMPKGVHFNELIDSSINIIDDSLDKTAEDGLMLSPTGGMDKLVSLYKNSDFEHCVWSISIDKQNDGLIIKNNKNKTALYLDPDGKIGINKKDPKSALDIDGAVTSSGRVGNYKSGKAPANGKWHKIIENLDGCHAFEIMAGAGKEKSGRYALMHAIAVNTYNPGGFISDFFGSKKKITYNQAYYHWKCSKIKLRWQGDQDNYFLELKTNCNYGDGVNVTYHISRLWFDPFMKE
ncbi:MAG: hypothetical protein GY941_08315 [Planctomycetes bacterium]|nr:hypothetical protein [Planctomycetota bacterium]